MRSTFTLILILILLVFEKSKGFQQRSSNSASASVWVRHGFRLDNTIARLTSFPLTANRPLYIDVQKRSSDEELNFRKLLKKPHDPELNIPATIPRAYQAVRSILHANPDFRPQTFVTSPYDRTITSTIIMAHMFRVQTKARAPIKLILDPRLGECKQAIDRCHQGTYLAHAPQIVKDRQLKFKNIIELNRTYAMVAREFGLERIDIEYLQTGFEKAGDASCKDLYDAAWYWEEIGKKDQVLIVTHDVVLRYTKHFLEHGSFPTQGCPIQDQRVEECGWFSTNEAIQCNDVLATTNRRKVMQNCLQYPASKECTHWQQHW